MQLKKILLPVFILITIFVKGQTIDSIYVNLYTDSLKKGTYNYINIDGQLSTGSFMPLDSSQIIFWASEGKFYGNNLWIDTVFIKDSVIIKVALRKNPLLRKEFTLHIKKKPDDGPLITEDDVLKEMQNKTRSKKKDKK